MSNERIGFYEGMFLFPQSATENLQGSVDHIKGILDKAGATIKTFRKWDDRRLAYEIDGNKRGVYFLAYFNAPASSLSELERMCNQSEEVLRMMVTKADHIPAETIEANEGAEELATEIKLRSEKSSEASAASGSQISKKDKGKSSADKAPAEAVSPEPVDEPATEAVEETTEEPVEEPVAEAVEETTEEPKEETPQSEESDKVDAAPEEVAEQAEEETTEA